MKMETIQANADGSVSGVNGATGLKVRVSQVADPQDANEQYMLAQTLEKGGMALANRSRIEIEVPSQYDVRGDGKSPFKGEK